ncbi:hypothetical protein H6F32_14340 [Anabaena sp. FACHB-1237]|uniref:hypothetical protein n=1 Tax=Anabaena sp. FACHB-1237 TaxID=2692769 RepID=UPI0016805CDB|nr:hypothetical protein [Anabaena sp. FACHB-1237]MBD2138735.1 hypothetical protein [Anabaena sp. FACHB-1237]
MKNLLLLTTILSLTTLITIPTFANPAHQNHQINHSNYLKPVVIPKNQLPTPLTRGMIFREIASGGITGRTQETVLMDDGRLLKVVIGDANDSQRSVKKVSLAQVRQFEKLLRKSNLKKFNRLSYPVASGAADYITYTLTGKTSTTQYNDISQSQLPNKLDDVVKAWNQLKNSAE